MKLKKLVKDEWALLTGLMMVVVAWLTISAIHRKVYDVVVQLLGDFSASNQDWAIIIGGVLILALLGQNLIKKMNG